MTTSKAVREKEAAMRVLKFGGACLESRARLEAVAEVVHRSPQARVVVVSAVAGVTDRLHHLSATRDRAVIQAGLVELRALHHALAPADSNLADGFDAILMALAGDLLAAREGAHHPPRARERIISVGERLSAVLVAGCLVARGTRAEPFPSERAGIRCDAKFGEAAIDLDLTRVQARAALLPVLAAGGVPVVTGYYGVTREGDIATFGRSGTDYTATALAYALGAERVELWKAVGGFLTADPALFPDSRVIAELSYEEATELSFYGARVIHPRALDPARDGAIPVDILDIGAPAAPGTRIASHSSHRNGDITAVSSRRGLALLRTQGRAAAGHQEAMGALALSLADAGVNIMSTASAQTSLGVLIEADDCAAALAAIACLPERLRERVEIKAGFAVICVVGNGLRETRGLVGRLVCSVVRAGVEVEMVSAGASEVACHLAVADDQVEAASRALVREFLEGGDVCRDSCGYLRPAGGLRGVGEEVH